jgi:CarD family transcriptional regulator
VVKLAVGSVVVYGAHGAGSIVARETRSINGEQQSVVVIALTGGLSVQLPLLLAEEQLRPIIDDAGIATVQEVLSATEGISDDSWIKRRRDAEAKLGDAIGLAEVIRDGNARDGAPRRGSGSRLSPGERELVRRARDLLEREIALAREITVADAGCWIDAQLSSSQ